MPDPETTEPAPAETTDDEARTTSLAELGWTDEWAEELTRVAAPSGSRPARVVRAERGASVVDDGAEELMVTTSAVPGVTTGDWVVVDPDDNAVALLTRRTAVRRAEASGRSHEQVLAANVDLVAVVVSLALEPDLGRLERLIAVAWVSGATPLVVLTKADLVDDADAVAFDVAQAAPGVDVVVVSSETGEGLGLLATWLRPGRTVVLLGQSGVGKSTLVNALAGEQRVATGVVGVTGKGRHVTTSRELVRLPSGALLLDTPGLRGVGVVGDSEGIDHTFPEIEALTEQCRFGDCSHNTEPGCAVLAALESGELAPRRLESWRKLLKEAEWMARRGDARLMAEERKRWKQIGASVRRSGVVRTLTYWR